MNEKILCGKTLSQQILDMVSDEVENLRVNNQRQPALAVVLVGSDPASQVYVRNKKNACEKVAVKSLEYILPAETNQAELVNLIQQLNADESVDGILVQLPLPAHLDSK